MSITSRVLIVDDKPDIAQLWRVTLEMAGITADTATSGEEALEAYSTARHDSSPYALIVLDLAMPYINGFEVEERIRAAGDMDQKIAFLSAHPLELKTERAPLQRAVGIKSKPLAAQEFVEWVKSMLDE